jgi:hypothetical protein
MSAAAVAAVFVAAAPGTTTTTTGKKAVLLSEISSSSSSKRRRTIVVGVLIIPTRMGLPIVVAVPMADGAVVLRLLPSFLLCVVSVFELPVGRTFPYI